jgi:lipopolysaccharide transport system ATP-binding protein
MSSENLSISVDGLGKRYEIYAQPADRLKQMILPRLNRAMRKESCEYFKEFWALRNVSFNVRRGETVGIVGRNGCGKSTLLQMICGVLHPTLGNISVNGRIAALLELGAGFNPEFTGRENVFLSGMLYGLSEDELREKYDAILAFSEIGEFINQPVKTYSSGMYVRLAFAVAINVSPDILVVDEALAVGDEGFQRKCFARIEAIRDAGATVLFVSHSAGTVVELCDRAILLDQGELLTQGTPRHVVSQYQKLLYAPADRASRIREEIRASSAGAASTTEHLSALKDAGALPVDLKNSEPEKDEIQPYWDEGLVSSSTISYENRGAVIETPHLQALDGRKINVLVPGGTYVYTYTVRLERTLAYVRCGMMIRSITGIEVGGGATSMPQNGLPVVSAGAVLNVRFRFRCLLAPGTYFFNAGVLATLSEGEEYVDRRIDAVMFRVMPDINRLTTGFVDLDVVPHLSIAS